MALLNDFSAQQSILEPARRRSQQTNPYQDSPEQQALTQALSGGSQEQRIDAPQNYNPATGGFVASSDPRMQPAGTPDYNGYNAPQYQASGVGQYGLEGYDASKLNDPNHQSPKYVSGRIMSQYAPTQENYAKVAADIMKAYPGSTYNGSDKITLADGGVVDFVRDSDGSPAWQWGAESGPGGGILKTPAPAPTVGMPQNTYMALLNTPQMPNGTPQPGGAGVTMQAPGLTANTSMLPPGGGTTIPAPPPQGGTPAPQQDMTPAQAAAAGLGWVPRDHPLYGTPGFVGSTPAGGGAPPAPGGAPGGGPAYSEYGRYPARPDNTNYTPSQLSQFTPPDLSEFEGPQGDILRRILANPETMSAMNVQQLKESNKEESLSMQQQLMDKAAMDSALRGVSGGGAEVALRSRIGEAAMSDVLRGNRAIDLQKMSQDRVDQIQALQASDALMGNRLGRSISGYNTGLAGQLAQAGENLRGTQMAQQNYATDLDAFFNRLGADRGDRQLNIQQQLGQGGLDLDARRISQQGDQFNLSHQLAQRQFEEAMRQFNARMGFDWANFDYNAQMDPWR